MARKGDKYKQIPTLWHIGTGMPCRVMRRRHVQREIKGKLRWTWRWENFGHEVLTYASARRWKRLQMEGLADIRRDVNLEMFMQAGIVPIPRRQTWAQRQEPAS